MMSPLNGTHSLSSYRILADSLCSGGESDVSAMFSRIVAAAEPTDIVRLYEMLGCFIHQMGYFDGDGLARVVAANLSGSIASACASGPR